MIRGYGTTETGSGECEWLTESPLNGTVEPGMQQSVDITVNSADLSLGNYYANLILNCNDPLLPTITIPVNLSIVSVISVEDKEITPSNFSSGRGIF